MSIHRFFVPVLIACVSLAGRPAAAASSALIVVGTTGISSVTNEVGQTAATIRAALIQRGFAPDAIEVLSAPPGAPKITRDDVLQALAGKRHLAFTDEFWLVLLGFSGPTAGGATAFQVSGPRLGAAELGTALDAIPARQYVFIGTSASGGFIPALLKPNRDVLAATEAEGEIDLPRYPENWAAALKENPQAGWKQLAARAAELTSQYYTDNQLALGEHPRLGDAATGKILEPPFGVDSTAAATPPPSANDGSMALVNADDIKVEIHKPNDEWETQPATAETKKLIAEAKAAPNPDGFNAVMLEQRLGYRIGDDRTAEDSVLERIYIAKEDGVWRWANFSLPQDPPAVTTKLIAARIIQPDGSATVFNPAKMPKATDESGGLGSPLTEVFFPGAHAGCLVEIAYRCRRLLDADVPEYSEELPVQQDIPVLLTKLQLQVPASGKIHFKLRNLSQPPTETDANGVRTLSWEVPNLPGFEGLPFDPPQRDLVAALDISSLDSWDQFVTWYRRLARGSGEQDDTVKATAQELAEPAKNRLEKIRKAFEFVSALRYVAIEFGINGIRPRTPAVVLQNRYGDCKDKANLLIALLADMGIDARFVVLNRGSSTDTSFPSWQFNHAIAYVPKNEAQGQADDLWLDTTDSTAPFPTLSPGDIGRQGLVFNNDNTAQFLTVANVNDQHTLVEEFWVLKQDAAGHWNGTVQMVWGGLPEYEMRSSVRGTTPHQRDYGLQTMLTRQLPDADFSNLVTTDTDDLSHPFELAGRVSLEELDFPLSVFNTTKYFAASSRIHPMLINDGQQMHVVQNLELDFGAAAPFPAPDSFDQTAGGVHAAVHWELQGKTLRRKAELTIAEPLVAAADYPAVRQLLRDWAHHLDH